jgi:ankyrin repeat protein
MSTMPPHDDSGDEVDAEYRRWTASDPARPAASVRDSVLAHAARLTDERSRKHTRRKWGVPVFGGLAAAALAGLLVYPHLLAPTSVLVKREPATASNNVVRPPQIESVPAVSAPAPAAPPARAYAPAPVSPLSSVLNASIAQQRSKRAAEAASVPQDRIEEVDADNKAEQPQVIGEILAGQSEPSISAGVPLRREAQFANAQVDLNARDKDGRTPLMLAVLKGSEQEVTALLARGADPNAKDADGETPLHAAILGHHVEIATALQRSGAR